MTPAETTAEVPAVEGLSVNSESVTQTVIEALTSRERPIYYKGKSIGKGEFSEVGLVFRAHDGLVFAALTFKPPPNKRKRKEKLPAWPTRVRREFTLMRDNPHVSCATVVLAVIMNNDAD